ncbi:hypothetical protein [Pedobacter sp. ASV28]|uniref:hypothetical protein n=1 Tax=Pedobacter sp. ASV28 TaxID=2795123 RepID=UPI0018EDAE6D|nr:hypothetical protein [Pedobacter sp. ASV28]
MGLTPSEVKRANAVLKSYQFKALLSILSKEQREQYDSYIQEHLPDLKATLEKFLARYDAEDIVRQLKK